MTILSTHGLTKAFAGFKAVADVDLGLQSGELRGLIGSNGAGKSTLLHLIYGRQEADAGTIVFRGEDVTAVPAGLRARRGMGLVFQIANLFGDLTVEQNLRLGALPKRPGARVRFEAEEVDRVLELIELTDLRDHRAEHLSHGRQQWLEIGMVLLTQPVLLLLDEPTSGMTRSESRKTAALLRALMEQGEVESMIVVEHNIEFISLVSDRVTVMHRGGILAEGTIEDVQANLEVPSCLPGEVALTPLLSVRNLDAGYGSSSVLRDITFEVQRGSIFCVLGRNGAGKTTLLRALMGVIDKQGRVELAGDDTTTWSSHRINRAGMVWVPQDDSVFSGLSVREHLTVARRGHQVETGLGQAAELFPILGDRLDQEAQTLSGGERKMLAIAQALISDPQVILMDEPTEGVAPVVVEQLIPAIRLAAQHAAVVLVEQNIDTAVSLGGNSVVLEHGRVAESGDIKQLQQDGILEERLAL